MSVYKNSLNHLKGELNYLNDSGDCFSLNCNSFLSTIGILRFRINLLNFLLLIKSLCLRIFSFIKSIYSQNIHMDGTQLQHRCVQNGILLESFVSHSSSSFIISVMVDVVLIFISYFIRFISGFSHFFLSENRILQQDTIISFGKC